MSAARLAGTVDRLPSTSLGPAGRASFSGVGRSAGCDGPPARVPAPLLCSPPPPLLPPVPPFAWVAGLHVMRCASIFLQDMEPVLQCQQCKCRLALQDDTLRASSGSGSRLDESWLLEEGGPARSQQGAGSGSGSSGAAAGGSDLGAAGTPASCWPIPAVPAARTAPHFQFLAQSSTATDLLPPALIAPARSCSCAPPPRRVVCGAAWRARHCWRPVSAAGWLCLAAGGRRARRRAAHPI